MDRTPRSRFCPLLALLLLLGLLGSCHTPTDDGGGVSPPRSGRVTILRDAWGVPHVYGSTMSDALYGFGYAQAQDHLEIMLVHFAVSEGRAATLLMDDDPAARAAGYAGDLTLHDRSSLLFRVRAAVDDRWNEIDDLDGEGWDASSSELLAAFAAGIQRYMDDHPGAVPAWWAGPIEPQTLVAWQRRFLLGYQMAIVAEKLGMVRSLPPDMSNQWVVGPSRSADGAVYLQADPHLPWSGATLWYEAHLEGGPLSVAGATLYGLPFIPMAHTPHIAFSETSNHMDNADVFLVQVDPTDPTHYLYGSESRPFVFDTFMGARPDGSPYAIELAWTHQGPVVLPTSTDFTGLSQVAVGAATVYDQVHAFAQVTNMVLARNVEEWKAAMEPLQLQRWNFVVGDTEGHIFYVNNSRHPDRRDGVSWQQPVDGSDPANDWTVLPPMPFSWLAQAQDPPGGYLQNCNNSPGWVTATYEEVIDETSYPTHYVPNKSLNPRGRRALSLLEDRDDWDLEALEAMSMDEYLLMAEWWVPELQWARAQLGDDPGLQAPDGTDAALAHLCGTDWPAPCTAWDWRADAGDTHVLLFRRWVAAAGSAGVSLTAPPPSLDPNDPAVHQLLLDGLNVLAQVYVRVLSDLGTVAVPWGQVHRIARGAVDLPIGGASPLLGGPLHIVSTNTYVGNVGYAGSGSSYMKLVRLGPDGTVTAVSVKPWGQAEDPDSPHYADLTELFAGDRYKELWFERDEVEAHLGPPGTTELEWP